MVSGIQFFGYLVFILLDILFENIFSRRYIAYMSALMLGLIIATINAFIVHKYVTFKSRVKGKRLIPEFFRFFLTYVFTFTLSLFLLPFFVELINVHPRISGAMVILICTVISYVAHSRFSFRSA